MIDFSNAGDAVDANGHSENGNGCDAASSSSSESGDENAENKNGEKSKKEEQKKKKKKKRSKKKTKKSSLLRRNIRHLITDEHLTETTKEARVSASANIHFKRF